MADKSQAQKKENNSENDFIIIGNIDELISKIPKEIYFLFGKEKKKIQTFIETIQNKSVLLYFNNGLISYKIIK